LGYVRLGWGSDGVGRRPTHSATVKGEALASGAVDRITLDRAVFKVLASDTRLDILKALDERQKTVTELARELSLNKATVFEHLEKLNEVGLIQKIEEDVERKWVYWQLSWTGRRLLHPEKITLAILLSSALGTLLTAFAAVLLWWRSGQPLASPQEKADGPVATAAPMTRIAVEPQAVAHDPTYLAIAAALGVVLLALVAWAWRVRRRSKLADVAEPPTPS